MKKLIYIPALLLLAACSNKPKDKKAELADLQKQQSEINNKIAKLQAEIGTPDVVTEVNVAEVKTGPFVNYVQIQGKIDAQDNVTAYSIVPGTITNIYVRVGEHVTKGQLLVQLDNSVVRQNIAQAEAKANLSQQLYQRQKALWDQKIGTEVQFLQAQTTLQADKKALSAAREQANQFRIVAPISGSIDQMDLKLGQAVQPGQPGNGIRIVNADILKVKADVPESYAGSVRTGNNVKIVIPDAQDSLTTKVTFAAKAIDPTSRSFAVEIKLPARKNLRPNMTAILKIADYAKTSTITVPVKALQHSEDGDYVYINANGVAKRTVVKAGSTYGGQTEILSGLKAGDQLITNGVEDIEDGDKIKVAATAN
ncbi:efflux RND transporter periplasmic adaptor subunit [Mucilaginibacter sp. AK015]|uniref:efflux RND transporter periplasmic adaptor subunit n=1 Tax=Mucilaginibacter sp. AK015 TaxID=2723072 RepID=UPI001620ADEB|nr:efflux RND transporter periplasmic adaptor subunit [Mucilaginibacter sp. AK015]MBB5394417.1 RND family efflux transporter MFP subunit [Mucilaginibacter sp. AK015]